MIGCSITNGVYSLLPLVATAAPYRYSAMKVLHVPDNLAFDNITLKYEKFVEPEEDSELVPFYHFKILDSFGLVVGHINFRVGDTRHVQLFAGHIGYGVLPEHRGHSYALSACRALKPFIQNYYASVILTSEVDNHASLRIIEKLGADFLEELDVPEDDPSFASGARRKRRFKWAL